MSKTREVTTRAKRQSSNKKLAVVSVILASIIIVVSVLSFSLLQAPRKFSLKAAIVDQLNSQFPNETFHQTVFSILTEAGFNITYYGSEDVNVTFYKELINHDYGIIILRSHSALREDNRTVDLFTSEEYSKDAYSWEQRNGLLTKGNYSFEPGKFYFAIAPKFIDNLAGRLPKSIIIAMGCWSIKLGSEDLARAFLNKGAIAYIGWTNIVIPPDTDRETTELLKLILKENMTLSAAVNQAKTYSYRSGSITVQSRMNLYPPSSWNINVTQLIEEARNSETPKTSNNPASSLYLITNVALSKAKDSLTELAETICQYSIAFLNCCVELAS
jgi:hypothetical protein